MTIGETRADLKHCGKMPDAREELNRSVKEGRIESRIAMLDEKTFSVGLTFLRYLAFTTRSLKKCFPPP